MALETLSSVRSFGGTQLVLRHDSQATATPMEFSVYLPPQAEKGPVPFVTFLSGLTCTWENFTAKAGAQRYAAELGLGLVAPDTSPRGTELPGEHDDWDFGSGAGFYVDASEAPWSAHYRMYSYVTQELPTLLAELPLDRARQGLSGHSMGGHGALVAGLRNPEVYASLSAFAPICAPASCPWGKRAFTAYLGADEGAWHDYDATELIASRGYAGRILVDQGLEDGFLDEQLMPERLRDACKSAGASLELRLHAGYDHSYYFIASFIGDHLRFHAANLAEG